MTHTKGKWRVHTINNISKVATDDGYVIADNFGVSKEEKANARLIASAPDLLEALKKVQIALAQWRDNEPILDGLALEEVKYVIVDPIIEQAEGGINEEIN